MRPILKASVLAVALLATAPAHAQDVVFDLDMLFQYDRLTPDFYPGINNRVRMSVTLSGKNTVRVARYRRVGPFVEDISNQATLGQEGQRGSWRVVNASTIRGTLNFPNSTRVTTLTTTGGNSCSVQVVDQLKPGFRDFVFRRMDGGGMAKFSQPRLVSSSCTVR